MNPEKKKCLYVEKGRCGKPTESSEIQCLLCIGSGMCHSSILLVRTIASAKISIGDAGFVLDAIERIDRFIEGYNKLIKEKFASKEEFKEMLEAVGKMDKQVLREIKEKFQISLD